MVPVSPVRGWDSVMVVSVVDSIIVSTTRSGWPVPPPLSHTNYPDYLVYWILEPPHGPATALATHPGTQTHHWGPRHGKCWSCPTNLC